MTCRTFCDNSPLVCTRLLQIRISLICAYFFGVNCKADFNISTSKNRLAEIESRNYQHRVDNRKENRKMIVSSISS